MVVFDTVKDCLRFCCEENDTAILLHLYYITFFHWSTTTAGDYYIAAGLHFNEKICLKVTEVLLTVCFKDVGNTHSLSLGNNLIHLYNVHGKDILKEIGDCRLSRAHETDQYDVVVEKLSCLDTFTVGTNAFKYICYFIFVASAFHSVLKPFFLFRFLLRL